MSELSKRIRSIINELSEENNSNTPDFILAEYLVQCLRNFESAANAREKWHSKGLLNTLEEKLNVKSQ